MLEKILEELMNRYRKVRTDEDLEWNRAVDMCSDIIRKHMNDGWIPVEERLPTEEERIGGYDRGIPWSRRLEVAYMTDTVEYTFGYYDGFKFYDKRHRKIKNVIAWTIHEPYRPKKGEANGK